MCISIENRKNQFTAANIKNKELRDYANEIAGVVADGRKARIKLCGILAEMASKDIYSQFGGNFSQFVEERLGLKKSQAYDMVRVGAVFGITRDNDWKPALSAHGGEWTQTQLMCLLPMGGTSKTKLSPEETLANCEGLVKRGLIKPSMTVAELKEIVKEERPDKARLEENRKKREQLKATKEEIEREEEEKQAKLKGERIACIEVWKLSGGEIYVTFDGEEKQFTSENLSQMVQTMLAARNCTDFGNN